MHYTLLLTKFLMRLNGSDKLFGIRLKILDGTIVCLLTPSRQIPTAPPRMNECFLEKTCEAFISL